MTAETSDSNESDKIEQLREDRLKQIIKEEVKKETRQKDKKIQKLEKEVERLKSNSNKLSTKNPTKNSKGISRRQFLKKAGLGTAGLAALMTPASALNIRSDGFSVSTGSETGSLTERLSINDGDLNLGVDTGLDANQNNVTNVAELVANHVKAEEQIELPTQEADNDNRIWVDEDTQSLKVKIQGRIFTAGKPAIPDSEHYHPGNEGSGTLIKDVIGVADLTLDKDNWRAVLDFEGGVGFEVNDGDNIGTADIGTPSERTLIVRVFADSFHGGNQSNVWSYGGNGDPELDYYEDDTDWRYDTPSDRLIVSESTWAGEIRIVATRIDSSEANLDVWKGDKSKVGDDSVSNPDTSYDNEGADLHLGEGIDGARYWDGVIDPNMITYNRRLSDSELNDVIQEWF